MYSTKAFKQGTRARLVLENSINTIAKEVRLQVIANLHQGMSLNEYFNIWYHNIKTDLEQLIKY